MDKEIMVQGIFKSISGETSYAFPQGSVCAFIRFAGCNLYPNSVCKYCDTVYAQNIHSGKKMSLQQIEKALYKLKTFNVVISGGEPLLQKDMFYELCDRLIDSEYTISVETNGTIPIDDKYIDVSFVIDWKLKSSGASLSTKKKLDILSTFPENSIVKFVISSMADFNESLLAIKKIKNSYSVFSTSPKFVFAFSPCAGKVTSTKLYGLLMSKPSLAQEENIILNLQIHKIIDVL